MDKQWNSETYRDAWLKAGRELAINSFHTLEWFNNSSKPIILKPIKEKKADFIKTQESF